MSEGKLAHVLSHFDSVKIASLAALLGLTEEAVENEVCRLVMEGKLTSHRIEGEYIVRHPSLSQSCKGDEFDLVLRKVDDVLTSRLGGGN